MTYNIGNIVKIISNNCLVEILDSEIILNKEIYYTSDSKSYSSEQLILENLSNEEILNFHLGFFQTKFDDKKEKLYKKINYDNFIENLVKFVKANS